MICNVNINEPSYIQEIFIFLTTIIISYYSLLQKMKEVENLNISDNNILKKVIIWVRLNFILFNLVQIY